MVGTSYLDTLTKWKDKEGISGILSLKDTIFLSPLMILKGMPKDLYLFCVKKLDGTYKFLFKSIMTGSEATAKEGWQDHFRGELSFKEGQKTNKVAVNQLKEKTA